MFERLRAAVLVALVGAFGLTASAQITQAPQNHTIATNRFYVVYAQPLSGGTLSVIRDFHLPNAPCMYLFQSTYAVAQLVPTPGGAC